MQAVLLLHCARILLLMSSDVSSLPSPGRNICGFI